MSESSHNMHNTGNKRKENEGKSITFSLTSNVTKKEINRSMSEVEGEAPQNVLNHKVKKETCRTCWIKKSWKIFFGTVSLVIIVKGLLFFLMLLNSSDDETTVTTSIPMKRLTTESSRSADILITKHVTVALPELLKETKTEMSLDKDESKISSLSVISFTLKLFGPLLFINENTCAFLHLPHPPNVFLPKGPFCYDGLRHTHILGFTYDLYL